MPTSPSARPRPTTKQLIGALLFLIGVISIIVTVLFSGVFYTHTAEVAIEVSFITDAPFEVYLPRTNIPDGRIVRSREYTHENIETEHGHALKVQGPRSGNIKVSASEERRMAIDEVPDEYYHLTMEEEFNKFWIYSNTSNVSIVLNATIDEAKSDSEFWWVVMEYSGPLDKGWSLIPESYDDQNKYDGQPSQKVCQGAQCMSVILIEACIGAYGAYLYRKGGPGSPPQAP
jgi:hypothetical protein